MRLAGEVAVVTAAASGFGEGIARADAAEGARVVVADLNEAGARAVAASLGQAAVASGGDASKGPDCAAIIDRAVPAFGGLAVVVNNAGTTHRNKPLLEVTEAGFDRVCSVNVRRIYRMTQASVPRFRGQSRDGQDRGGAIITIGLCAGIRPRPGLTRYNGPKGAANTITLAMAQELAKDDIRVNAICPVIGATALLEAFMGMPDPLEKRARFLATIPLGRMSTPAEIAKAAVRLADPASSFITGILLPVDGGHIA